MKIVCISDTHGLHRAIQKIPDGDILIHAGDMLNRGTTAELMEFAEWFYAQPHKTKICIAGNHDLVLQHAPLRNAAILHEMGICYLRDKSIVVDGLKIYGSPWTPTFFNWAFMADEPVLARKWEGIAEGLDILITHGPMKGVLDRTAEMWGNQSVGSTALAERVKIARPRLHVFGHIHHGYGREDSESGTIYVNASICTEDYRPTNKPIVVEL